MFSASDIMPELALYFMIFASFTFHHTKVHFLPPFEPNDYLWETHADKGDRWEIYAWAIRDIISKEGKLTLEERNSRDIFTYREFCQKKTDVFECADGTIFHLNEKDTTHKNTTAMADKIELNPEEKKNSMEVAPDLNGDDNFAMQA